jgi:antitoxin CptB
MLTGSMVHDKTMLILKIQMGVNMFEAKRRRGMLELDVLFLPFVEQAFDDLTKAQQLTFERLLTCDDPDLFAWFMGHKECQDPDLNELVGIVLNRVKISCD